MKALFLSPLILSESNSKFHICLKSDRDVVICRTAVSPVFEGGAAKIKLLSLCFQHRGEVTVQRVELRMPQRVL